MSKSYRIIFESYDKANPEECLDRSTIWEDDIEEPTNCINFSISHEDQISIIAGSVDKVLATKAIMLEKKYDKCPKCSGKLIKHGENISIFHDVFSDHQITMHRFRCASCKHEIPTTIRTVLGGNVSGSLAKTQAELGAMHTFRESETIFKIFSAQDRKINNRNRIKNVVNDVGVSIEQVDTYEKSLLKPSEAKELVVHVDGGHVKTTEDARSVEALAAVVYQPEALLPQGDSGKNYLKQKSCAASVKNDNQKEMVSNTILAALREGLTPNTHITALCDGAVNCWNVIKGLNPLCRSTTCILDWFHIGMKIQNISLPKALKDKLEKVKWHLWRGNVENALERLDDLIIQLNDSSVVSKIKKFKNYILNNEDKIVNYEQRQKNRQVFTSNLAESTVESLINRRCKGRQHMRWSREGLNPVLQLRAKIHTQDWGKKWKSVLMNSALYNA